MHDAEAREVDQETFYRTRESGGTVISSAYRLAEQMVTESYPTDSWNLYLFHFSDGDNWSQGDTDECVELMRTRLLSGINLFGYGQVESPYGTGQFLHDVEEAFRDDERVVSEKDRRDEQSVEMAWPRVDTHCGTGARAGDEVSAAAAADHGRAVCRRHDRLCAGEGRLPRRAVGRWAHVR